MAKNWISYFQVKKETFQKTHIINFQNVCSNMSHWPCDKGLYFVTYNLSNFVLFAFVTYLYVVYHPERDAQAYLEQRT